MSVLGIDIGTETIKIVEMAKAGRGYKLLNYAIGPTPPGSVTDGDIQDPQQVGEAIRDLVREHRIRSTRAVTSVQGQKTMVVRIIDNLPRMSKNELAANIDDEVARHIPFPPSQVIMDYCVVERPNEAPDSPNMEVLFAAVQPEVVDLVIEALKVAKLKPVAIEVQPLALSRSLIEVGSDGGGIGQTVAVVNVGATVTELCVIRDGLLHFPRTMPIAGRGITQRLSEGLGISEQQAEMQKVQYGCVTPLPPGARPEPAAAAEVPAEELTLPGEAELAFPTFDESEESDVGFGGTGTGGFTFTTDEEPAAEVHVDEGEAGRDAFELSDDLDTEGPTFNFGLDDDPPTKHSLLPDDDEDDGPPPVPEGEAEFELGEDVDLETPAFHFEFTETEEETPEPPAAPAPAEAAEAAEAATAVLGEADEEPALGFEFSTDEGSTETQTGEDVEFSFDLGGGEAATSLPAAGSADDSSSTDVGASFDLADLATQDEGGDSPTAGLGFVIEEEATDSDAGGIAFGLDDIGEAPTVAPAAAATVLPPAGVGDEAAQVRQVMEPVMREIAVEISRSLDFYRSRYEGTVIDQVVVVGGTARVEGLPQFLEDELGVAVDRGDPLARVVIANPRLTDEDLRRDAPVLAVAVGLALRELM